MMHCMYAGNTYTHICLSVLDEMSPLQWFETKIHKDSNAPPTPPPHLTYCHTAIHPIFEIQFLVTVPTASLREATAGL